MSLFGRVIGGQYKTASHVMNFLLKRTIFCIVLMASSVSGIHANTFFESDAAKINVCMINHQLDFEHGSIEYYDSILSVTTNKKDIFFCRLARSLCLYRNQINLATEEIILTQALLFENIELEDERPYLEFVEGRIYEYLGKNDKAKKLYRSVGHKMNQENNPQMFILIEEQMLNMTVHDKAHYDLVPLYDSLITSAQNLDFGSENMNRLIELRLENAKSAVLVIMCSFRPDLISTTQDLLNQLIIKSRKLDQKVIMNNATGNLAFLHSLKGEYEKMVPLAHQDLKYSLFTKNMQSVAGIHILLANAYFKLDVQDSMLFHLKKSEQYFKHIRNTFLIDFFLNVSNQVYRRTGNQESAFASVQHLFEELKEIYEVKSQIDFELIKSKNNLHFAEKNIVNLNKQNELNKKVNWLLIFLLLTIAFLTYNFYRLHRIQKKYRFSLESINSNLESEVKKRTQKVVEQSEKIRSYAFHNSHRTRAPVARLLGLVALIKAGMNTEQNEIIEHIHSSTLEIDQVISEMNKALTGNDNRLMGQ